MNLLTRLFALHFDRSFSGKGWRQLAWLFGVIVTVFLLIYLVSFAFIFRYDLDKKSRREGQIINYIYDFKNKYGNVPQSCPPDNELKDSWNKLSVSLQWSNLYSAYSISPKLRSIGITDGYVKLDNDQITLLAEVEHNRWNMEKLLLGFRKPTAEEEELIYGSKEMGDIFKKKRFVHPDIRPYDELKESSKAYDRCITAGIPLVVNNNT